MIAYDYMNEEWMDDDDEDFKVPMTPDCDPEELRQKFATKEEFLNYYYYGITTTMGKKNEQHKRFD